MNMTHTTKQIDAASQREADLRRENARLRRALRELIDSDDLYELDERDGPGATS
jgi:hypothetical protein